MERLDDGVRGGEQALAEQDQGEQAVALGDVVGVPGRRALPLGDDRDREFRADEDDERDLARLLGQHEEERASRPGERRYRPRRTGSHGGCSRRSGCAQPLGDHRDAHDEVGEDQHRVVGSVNAGSTPAARTSTPDIWTMVITR